MYYDSYDEFCSPPIETERQDIAGKMMDEGEAEP